MNGSKTPRRQFLQLAAAAAVAAPAVTVSCGGSRTPYRYLTAQQARTLGALCDRIIPADADPGAGAAGVLSFIDRQLGGPYRRYRRTYREGLIAIDELAQARFSRPFAQLPASQAGQVLAALERGPAAAFFRLAVEHTMQGFYGDPRHGGNAEAASWKMLGVPAVPIRGRRKMGLARRTP
jgi:gluconate 2-dehydrogenase gamma chain